MNKLALLNTQISFWIETFDNCHDVEGRRDAKYMLEKLCSERKQLIAENMACGVNQMSFDFQGGDEQC